MIKITELFVYRHPLLKRLIAALTKASNLQQEMQNGAFFLNRHLLLHISYPAPLLQLKETSSNTTAATSTTSLVEFVFA